MSNKLSSWLNLFFNPLEYKNLPRAAGDTPTDTMYKHMAGLTVGLGGTAALAGYLHSRKNKLNESDKENEEAYMEAANQIVSIDKSTRDAKREEKLRQMGLDKQAEESFSQQLTYEGKDALHPAASISVALAAALAGWRLGRSTSGQQAAIEKAEKAKEVQNDIDTLLYEQYVKSRGLDKVATVDVNDPYVGQQKPDSSLGDDLIRDPSKVFPLAASIYGVAAAGVIALAYSKSKAYMDGKDPNVQRKKILQEALKLKMKRRTPGIFSDVSELPSVNAPKPTKASGHVALPNSLSAPNTAEPPITDYSDPYAKLLAQG